MFRFCQFLTTEFSYFCFWEIARYSLKNVFPPIFKNEASVYHTLLYGLIVQLRLVSRSLSYFAAIPDSKELVGDYFNDE